MSEIEIQKFEKMNLFKISQLQLLQQKLEKKKQKMENDRKVSIWISNLISCYGKQITVATGVISFVGGTLITQDSIPLLGITGGSMTLMEGLQYGVSLNLKPELQKINQINSEIGQIKSEISLRKQMAQYLSYRLIFGSIGFYQQSLEEKWVIEDPKVQFLLQKMIQQVKDEMQLEMEYPDEYEKMMLEKEAILNDLDDRKHIKKYG